VAHWANVEGWGQKLEAKIDQKKRESEEVLGSWVWDAGHG